jgi:hypothetical protein
VKKLTVKASDCSYDQLVRVAKAAGFVVKGGKKHCKIESKEGKFITVIPRKTRLKRETTRGIVEAFNRFGAEVILK